MKPFDGEITLTVPAGLVETELDLMRALAAVVEHFDSRMTDALEIERAVNWLHARYGTREGGEGEG